VTIAAALLVLLLALGAVLFPRSDVHSPEGRLLVLVGWGQDGPRQELIQNLGDYLTDLAGRPLETVLVRDRDRFFSEANQGADFVFCPDGLALGLAGADYAPLVAGNRKMPGNLRPRGTVVYRRGMGLPSRPWEEAAGRTVFGDSLSLVAVGAVPHKARSGDCAFGPDPYDHGSVLHALRLGAFDFAFVRQWDAEAFFASGLLDPDVYGMEMVTDPVPDVVLMASRKVSLVQRMAWAEDLSLLDLGEPPITTAGRDLVHSLSSVGLSGFQVLLEPDFERLRGEFSDRWPPAAH